MSDEKKKQPVIKLLQEAIEKAKNWAEVGWPVTFGPQQYPVNSMQASKDLPRHFPYRQEAEGYWFNVQTLSIEVTKHLEGALADLEQDNLRAAQGKAYAAQYVEKPLEAYTDTSKPVYDALQAL